MLFVILKNKNILSFYIHGLILYLYFCYTLYITFLRLSSQIQIKFLLEGFTKTFYLHNEYYRYKKLYRITFIDTHLDSFASICVCDNCYQVISCDGNKTFNFIHDAFPYK